jgi:tRNA pseudouridine38-40 synthase
VVTFNLPEVPDLWRLAQGVSHLMKGELAVLSAEIVHDSFHPGIDSTHKQYSYRILNRPSPAVLDARRVWHISRPLNLELMQACAGSLLGEHDFSSFQDSECCAMVRNIVGSLVDVGRGRLKVTSFSEILANKDRRTAGVTAPAHALSMDWVSYDPLPDFSAGTKP